ncbi:MAG: hypothetical protein H6739_37110 [Alphaproteobacteria bacterium]|nr:hypothetical protein [Alphaproteobacteria bacterium]
MRIGIVDFKDTPHGDTLARAAWDAGLAPEAICWLAPSRELPAALREAPDLAALAVPVGLRGATPLSRVTRAWMKAFEDLQARGVPVFVSTRPGRPNLLASVATPIPDQAGTSASVGAVLAAIRAARMT